MKLENVQQYVSDRIMAVPALAAFGPPIIWSPFLDILTLRAAIDTQLRTKGVCIAISSVGAKRVGDRTIRGVTAEANFEVWAEELKNGAHSPSGELLRAALIDAITAFTESREPRAEFESADPLISEHGNPLQALSFSIRVIIT